MSANDILKKLGDNNFQAFLRRHTSKEDRDTLISGTKWKKKIKGKFTWQILSKWLTKNAGLEAAAPIAKKIFEGKLNEFEGKPIPMDTPNEFAYLEFKKWVYKNRSLVKKEMLKHVRKSDGQADSSRMFMTLCALWYKWAHKYNKAFTHIMVQHKLKFGRALMVMMVQDNLIFDKKAWKKDNNMTHVKEGKLNEGKSTTLKPFTSEWDSLENVHELIERRIIDNPPSTLKEGNFIKNGCDPELDRLKTITRDGKNWIAQLEAKEKKRTGISVLKIGYVQNTEADERRTGPVKPIMTRKANCDP